MAIKNYTTKINAVQTVGEIQALLATHGARKVMMDYDDNGNVECVTFGLFVNGSLAGFKIDAKPDGVIRVMKKDGIKCDPVQAQRIAWRNIKDWIAAQLALVETEQATMDQVFLPYLTGKGEKTLYETVLESGMPTLLEGRAE